MTRRLPAPSREPGPAPSFASAPSLGPAPRPSVVRGKDAGWEFARC